MREIPEESHGQGALGFSASQILFTSPRLPCGQWNRALAGAGFESRILSWSSLSRFRGSQGRSSGREDSQGENPGREGSSDFPLPEPAALGLLSGGCSSKLRQVSTSSPRGGGRARHSEARSASAAWHRGPPVPHTPVMPGTPRRFKQPPEPVPPPDWGGAKRPQEDPPSSGPLRLRSAFNRFPSGSPPLTWHPAAAGKSGASRPPPLHPGTGLSPGGFEAEEPVCPAPQRVQGPGKGLGSDSTSTAWC